MSKLKLLVLFSLFISINAAPPKAESDNLELFEKNYNQLALISGCLLATSAALNYNKLMLFANSYYIQARPYLNQQNFARASFLAGAALAMPLLYLKFRKKDKKG